ncbi:MAG: methyltransferase domain-containing protein [Oligoflexia bacterium]|nr:methyltransferase domain-containing protein [Oligoflexia bacterium]
MKDKKIKLSIKYKKQIICLFEKHASDVEVWAYGSRVSGDCHSGSDLDLVLRAEKLNKIQPEKMNNLIEAFTESNIPFLVELRDWARLSDSFKKEIESNYVVLFKPAVSVDYFEINEKFWNNWSKQKGPWSRKYSSKRMQEARQGHVDIAPPGWLPKNLKDLNILGLAAGGGQQMPLLSAGGAHVTSFDFSEEQLKRDREVCKEEGLKIKTQKGNMEDLSIFSSESFDIVINPVSTCFTANVRKVYKEVYRVLKTGGCFLTSFMNPVFYALNQDHDQIKEMRLVNLIPYSDVKSLSKKEIEEIIKDKDSLEFGHSLSDLIGGQTDLGFKIMEFREYKWKDFGRGKEFDHPIDTILPTFISTKAVKSSN